MFTQYNLVKEERKEELEEELIVHQSKFNTIYERCQMELSNKDIVAEKIENLEEQWIRNRMRIRKLCGGGTPISYIEDQNKREEALTLEALNEDILHYIYIQRRNMRSLRKEVEQLTSLLKVLPKEDNVTEHRNHRKSIRFHQ